MLYQEGSCLDTRTAKLRDVFSKLTVQTKKKLIASTTENVVKGERHGAALDWMY